MSNKNKLALSTLVALVIAPLSGLAALARMPEVKLGNEVVKLEVASTDKEVQRGLMYRTNLPETQGMVFLFNPPRPVAFWMYHCFITLDMLFIKDGKIAKISHNVPPCKSKISSECPTYPADGQIEVDQVIEVAGGYCERHGVKEGDSVSVDFAK